jgi:signal transduction histidine kinase
MMLATVPAVANVQVEALLERADGAMAQLHYSESISMADSVLTLTTDQRFQARAREIKGKSFMGLNSPVKALKEFNWIFDQRELKEDLITGRAHNYVGDIYRQEGSFDHAEGHYLVALKIFRLTGKDELAGEVHWKVGKIYQQKHMYSQALSRYHSALGIYEESGNLFAVGELNFALGHLYYKDAQLTNATDHLSAAREIFADQGLRSSQLEVIDVMLAVYQSDSNFSVAIGLAREAAELSLLDNAYQRAAEYFEQQSYFCRQIQDYRCAISQQEESVNLLREHRPEAVPSSLLKLAHLLTEAQRETEALLTFHEAMNMAAKGDDTQLIQEVAHDLSEFYLKREDYKNSHYYLNVSDSLRAEIALIAQSELRRKLNQKKLEQDSLLEQQGAEISALVAQKEKLYRNLLLGGILVLLLVLVFVFREVLRKKKLSKVLEWKVYKRTKELRSANKELNTYIYKSSHDLRTPLTNIKSLLRLLQVEEHNAATRKYMGLIDSCADQMDDILISLSRAVDYKKVEVKVEKVDFDKLKYDFEHKDMPQNSGVSIQWNIKENVPFFSDTNLIKVILKKTISNAIHYRKGENEDFCKVTITTDRNGAVMAIEDNGQGIPAKVKANVFDMFVKGTHKSKGAGLGLYIVKIVSEKLRGKITLESAETEGSKLIFQLPNLAT